MTRGRTLLLPVCLLSLLVEVGRAQTGGLAPVVSRSVSRTVELPGEVLPFLSVSLHAKVAGYVDRVLVDRGSRVRQ
jgi:membrane fusion protein (multidrug efflux system)